jgi:hypothetical protein
MPDPFTRALDHRYALERKISEANGFGGKKLFIVHALALPDIVIHQLALAPDAPREILVDRSDLEDLAAAVERVLAYSEGSRDRRVMPAAGEAMLESLLAPTFSIRVPLSTLFAEEERELVGLRRRRDVRRERPVEADEQDLAAGIHELPGTFHREHRLPRPGAARHDHSAVTAEVIEQIRLLFGQLDELIHRRTWPTKAELRTEVFDYIEVFYNRQRRHSTLGQLSPAN